MVCVMQAASACYTDRRQRHHAVRVHPPTRFRKLSELELVRYRMQLLRARTVLSLNISVSLAKM